MSEKILTATHTGVLPIGDIDLECHVLENGTRIFSAVGLLKAFDLQSIQLDQKNQPRILSQFLDRIRFISIGNEDLSSRINNPIRFIVPGKGGSPRKGYAVEILPGICDAVLKQAATLHLPEDLRPAAERSRILYKGFATVGIIALVDEATGYQEYRDRNALREILDQYLAKERSKWAKRFPDSFYKEMFRLKGWQWKGMSVNKPSVVGTYTNEIVYSRLAPGLLGELERLNPANEVGHRKDRHHQWLTDDIGHPALSQHIHTAIALMQISPDWGQFKRNVVRVFPRYGDQGDLFFDEDE